MSKTFKMILLLVFSFRSSLSFAEDARANLACSSKVCVINILSQNLVAAPCLGYSVLVAFSESSGATLIQCSKPDTLDNKLFIYNRNDSSAQSYEFFGGRFIRPDYLATAAKEGIPDKFGPIPLCKADTATTSSEGKLLIAEKQTTNNEQNPYCYKIYYVTSTKADLTIKSDSGLKMSSASAKAAQKWAVMRKTVSRHIETADPTVRWHKVTVTSAKAPLYTSPNSKATTRMYLVRGDMIEILDDSNPDRGWVRIRYITKSGKTLDSWIQSRDLE
jgi:hypothetical protein